MDLVEEYLLKADNYASAAQLVGAENSRVLIRLAAIWRNRALRAKLGARGQAYLQSISSVSRADARW
ncbi:MAG: hypothetical protein Q8R82_13150 [Hyphomonadaceae bacterium]|nr:hypothetical protein [Hyphomonadaceae bacterium]